MSETAKRRWAIITVVRIAGAAGAVLGVILLARASTLTPRIIGLLWTLASLWMMGVVPLALARKWRSPE